MSWSSPLIAKTEMSYSSTSAAATSSCVDSGFEAHSTTSAPPGLQRPHEVRGLGRDVQARRDAVAAQRLLALEALADRGEHRHLPVGPLDPPLAFRRRARGLSRRTVSSLPFDPFGLGGEEPLVLALFPLDPGEVVGAREPAVDRPRSSGSRRSRAANAMSPISTRKRLRSSASERSWFSSRRPYSR